MMKLPQSVRLILLTLLLAMLPHQADAQNKPQPVVIFVNGSSNCCTTDMGVYGNPERLGSLIYDLGMTKRETAWNNFNARTNADQASGTSTFVRQAIEFLNKLPDGTDVYLIGHSFGGDSLLSLVSSYRRSKINFRLLAVIDPVSSAGLRTTLDQHIVPKNVEYFYNVWQENQPYPFDFLSGGAVRSNALTSNQRANNYHRNADGSEVRENCSWIEVGCNDRRENPFNSRPGWKMKRAGHQGLTTDAYVLRDLQNVIRALAGRNHPSAGLVVDAPPPPPVKPLSGPASFPITVKVSKNDATTVHDSVAKVFLGGVAPLRFELLEQPKTYAYFSFDPESGIFIFRPTNTYSIESFRFAVSDAKGQRIVSQANISFDHADIFPGHPFLTKTPERPLPAAINPLITITSDQPNEVRRLENSSTEPAELLTVRGGSLVIEAEAFLENLEDNYVGVLDCTVDWNGNGGLSVAIKDNDDYPKNYFVQKSIPASSLQPYDVTFFRMTCMAPDMPVTVMDIPVVYVPNPEALKQALDKAEYTYFSNQGGTLKLSQSNGRGPNGERSYSYVLNSMECGQQEGTLLAATNANKLTINGSFDGLLSDGDPQRLVWLNVPVCGKTQPVIWKLKTLNDSSTVGGINFCSSSASDPDGDGWGWENNASCKVQETSLPPPPLVPNPSAPATGAPYCQLLGSDPDGDSWGWENNASCKMPIQGSSPIRMEGQLVSPISNKCLEVPLGHYERNEYAHVQLWDCYSGDNTSWRYIGMNLRTPNNRCMKTIGESGTSPRQVNSTPCDGSVAQIFEFTASGQFKTQDGLCLQSQENPETNGTRLIVAECNSRAAKNWKFSL